MTATLLSRVLTVPLRLTHRSASIGVALCWLFALSPALNADSFKQGIEAYHDGSFEKAVSAFESALNEKESAATRHNIALSLYQIGAPGEAVWQLERATLLDPLNPDYWLKLSALREQIGLYDLPKPWWLMAPNVLSESQWGWLGSMSCWLFLALVLIPRVVGLKRAGWMKFLAVISFLGCVLSVCAMGLRLTLEPDGIVVHSEMVPLRHAPAGAAPESGLARPGERARILDRHEQFLKIETEGNVSGWIREDAFRALKNEV